jgi:pyruvate dehydrogenase E2 component (dihydrolipoamide acetyltransferase)
MATAVIMPKFSMTQESGTVIKWLIAEGDPVDKGDPILEVETDKVIMEVEAPASGILRSISAAVGDIVPVTEIIAYITAEDEEWSAPLELDQISPGEKASLDSETNGKGISSVSPVAKRIADEQGIDPTQLEGTGPGGRVTRKDVENFLPGLQSIDHQTRSTRATPAARRLGREHQLDLGELSGSGPRERVQAADVSAAVQAQPPGTIGSETIIPLEGMRRIIADRMLQSTQSAPHFTLQVDVDMEHAEALRAEFNARGEVKITGTAQIVKACAWALGQHPFVNATLNEDGIHLLPQVNIGVAVALDEGLIVPVIQNADHKRLAQISSEIRDLGQRARANQLRPEDVSGSTFTVSNLGMFGIDRFQAIINPPESAILAVGRIARRPAQVGDKDEMALRKMMTLTLSVDHRVLDGAVAARFLADLRQGLEEPGWLVY